MNGYPIPINGSLTLRPQLFDECKAPIPAPLGSSFSALSTVPDVATAAVNGDGTVTVTAAPNITGITYIAWVVTTQDGNDWYGTFLVHVTDQAVTQKKYGQLTPI
jgi:hypothetical protein